MPIAATSRMNDAMTVIDGLLSRKKQFRNADFSRALGISPQAASKRLRRLVEAGVLAPTGGVARNTGYERASRLEVDAFFWNALSRDFPRLQYLELQVLVGAHLRRKEQVRPLLSHFSMATYVVVDFRGVETLSDPAAGELYNPQGWGPVACEAINATPEVERALTRARRHQDAARRISRGD